MTAVAAAAVAVAAAAAAAVLWSSTILRLNWRALFRVAAHTPRAMTSAAIALRHADQPTRAMACLRHRPILVPASVASASVVCHSSHPFVALPSLKRPHQLLSVLLARTSRTSARRLHHRQLSRRQAWGCSRRRPLFQSSRCPTCARRLCLAPLVVTPPGRPSQHIHLLMRRLAQQQMIRRVRAPSGFRTRSHSSPLRLALRDGGDGGAHIRHRARRRVHRRERRHSKLHRVRVHWKALEENSLRTHYWEKERPLILGRRPAPSFLRVWMSLRERQGQAFR